VLVAATISAATAVGFAYAAAADRLKWLAAALGALTFVLLLAQLLVQQRLLARERRQLAELYDLDRLKDDFVASVSHELRTPLTSIRGYLELVLAGEAGELTAEQRDFLGIVDRNSDRLLHLVSDLLEVAQIESGRLELDVAEEELGEFLAEAVAAASPLAAGHGVELALHHNGEIRVLVDRTRLGQVIDNLLSNALKFTHAGGRVDVRLSTSNGAVLVEIADTGIGISPADQERLFQRFYRAAPAAEQAIPGSGLGLWISKAIVEAHGGSIGVESWAGRGSTFRVTLPTETRR
jgi:signal transduction histidine kinase